MKNRCFTSRNKSIFLNQQQCVDLEKLRHLLVGRTRRCSSVTSNCVLRDLRGVGVLSVSTCVDYDTLLNIDGASDIVNIAIRYKRAFLNRSKSAGLTLSSMRHEVSYRFLNITIDLQETLKIDM